MAGILGSVMAETMRLSIDDLDSDLAEAGGAAGTYSASVVIPAGAIILDVVVHGVALWNAGTSAALNVGDAADADGFFTDVNVKATDLLAGESLNFAWAGGQHGAYLSLDYTSVATIGASYVDTRRSASERTITAAIVAAGTAATTGETLITVLYVMPGSTRGVFTAA